MEHLTLPSPSKIGVDGYAASSFVTADLEASTFSDAYPKCSDFQTKYAALQEHVGSDKHQTFPDYTIGKKKIHGSLGKCLRAGFRTPVEGKRGRWAG